MKLRTTSKNCLRKIEKKIQANPIQMESFCLFVVVFTQLVASVSLCDRELTRQLDTGINSVFLLIKRECTGGGCDGWLEADCSGKASLLCTSPTHQIKAEY